MAYEMPVIARISREELARSLDKPLDHPDVALLGGMTVVIHPIESAHVASVDAVQAALPSVSAELGEIAEAMAGIEEKLFARLRSSPAAANQFVLDPLGALENFGLIDAPLREKLERHRAAISAAYPAS